MFACLTESPLMLNPDLLGQPPSPVLRFVKTKKMNINVSRGVKAAAADGGRPSNGCLRLSLGLSNRVDAFRSKATVRHA